MLKINVLTAFFRPIMHIFATMREFILIMLCMASFMNIDAQTATVQLLNEVGETLAFAEVYDQTDQMVDYTDKDGRVVIELNCSKPKFVFQYIGYQDLDILLPCEKNYDLQLSMTPDIISLKVINIIGACAAEQAAKPYQVETIDRKQIAQFQSQTTVEALEQNGGAYIQRSQMGGGSPILRGFEANKVLLVVDGVRMNNAIYRSGHLQNAISVDQAILQNISTLYGPGSIIYGSDALGGVVHFQTLRPKFSTSDKTAISGGYYARYASANEENSVHAHLNLGSKKLASLTSLTYASFNDLKAGTNYPEKYPDFGKRPFYVDPANDEIIQNKNPEEQIYTGYDQTDLLQKFTYKIDDLKFLELNIQYSTTTDIPRYDELTVVDENGVPASSEWYYGPQTRLLTAVRFDSEGSSPFFDRYQVQAAYQRINEDRHNRDYLDSDLISNYETVDVYSANLDVLKKLDREGNQDISYGLEYRFNQVTSEADRFNRETGLRTTDVFTRYPSGGSDMSDLGAYALYQLKKKKYTMQLGARFNWNELNVQYSRDDFFSWPEYFYSGISQTNTAITWLAGFNYHIAENTHIRLFSGSAYRAPNVDDFGKIRVRTSSSVTIPNENLGPEKTWNIETGLHHSVIHSTNNFPRADVGITAYYTKINDAIIREAFAFPNGDSIYVLNGNELEVQGNVNAEEGYIVGLSFTGALKASQQIELNYSVNWQRGRSTLDNETLPLAHIPPLYGQVTLQYRKNKWGTAIKTLFNAKKSIDDFAPGTSDNEDFATPEGSLAWTTWNVFADYRFNKYLQIKCGVENIFDLHYRTFSSGLSSPGRNLKIGLYGGF
jgi:hemoglobin/transferrin/lactoferrin receptor protein